MAVLTQPATDQRADLWSNIARITIRSGVIVNVTSNDTNEAGDLQATFTVELAFAPAAGETITLSLSSSDTTEGTIDAA